MRVMSGICLALLALSSTACARPQPVTSEAAACAVATQKVTAVRGLPTSHVARCENLDEKNGDYPLALYAFCRQDLCGSTSMGWFAVNKRTGEVFEWDVTEEKPGRRIAR
ncbi:hypothetical protein [Brevundimonas sp. FT23028]|uniref:hypothetical protein n=1 Tax=Brevundimonas sp. FT23028 TaxID=3393748 RepID=UPI003B587457